MNGLYDIINQVHIGAGAIALFVGPFQFIRMIRLKWIKFHRLCGTVYVASVLLSSPLALIVSFHSSLKLAVAGTAIQSVLWFVSTLEAYRCVRQGRVDQHQAFMMMSYALTFSAPVVRMGIVILEQWFGINYQQEYETFYPILVWISFLPVCMVWLYTRDFPAKN